MNTGAYGFPEAGGNNQGVGYSVNGVAYAINSTTLGTTPVGSAAQVLTAASNGAPIWQTPAVPIGSILYLATYATAL